MKKLTTEALYISDTKSEFIIYDPKMRQYLDNENWDKSRPYFLGILNLRDNQTYDTWEVDRIWSKKGYGPLLYLLAMQETGNEGLMPSRVKSQVTPEAKRVWKEFYDGKGSDLVTYEDTEAIHHDEDYLNKKYFIDTQIDTSAAQRRHKQVIGQDPYGERFNNFIETADGVIGGEMSEIYSRD